MRTASVGWRCIWRGGSDEALEEFYFVEGGFRVPWSGFDDFESDMTVFAAVLSDWTEWERDKTDRVSFASQTVEK